MLLRRTGKSGNKFRRPIFQIIPKQARVKHFFNHLFPGRKKVLDLSKDNEAAKPKRFCAPDNIMPIEKEMLHVVESFHLAAA